MVGQEILRILISSSSNPGATDLCHFAQLLYTDAKDLSPGPKHAQRVFYPESLLSPSLVIFLKLDFTMKSKWQKIWSEQELKIYLETTTTTHEIKEPQILSLKAQKKILRVIVAHTIKWPKNWEVFYALSASWEAKNLNGQGEDLTQY